MKASELKPGQWFQWPGDWRVFQRLNGDQQTVEGLECIPARPLLPTPMAEAGFIPANEEVELDERASLKLS